MKTTADPLKHIAESSEKNKYTRLDSVMRVKKLPDAYVSGALRNRIQAASEGEGFLHLRVLMNGKPNNIGWNDRKKTAVSLARQEKISLYKNDKGRSYEI